ncbi:MAG: hypothetical protein ACLQT7_05535 [Candidatus Dormibacteria bacterium]
MWNDDSPTIAKEQKATEATEVAVNEPVDPPVAEVFMAQLQALRDRLNDVLDAAQLCAAQGGDSAFSACFIDEVERRTQTARVA